MGLAATPYGCVGGLIATTVPVLLRAEGVPVTRIAGIITLALSPMFWSFLLGPMLDVRYSKKFYAFALASLAAACIVLAVFHLHNVPVLTALLVAANTMVCVYRYAISSWLTAVIETHHYPTAGAVTEIANLGGAGAAGGVSIWLVRSLPLPFAAAAIAALILLPTLLLLGFPDIPVPLRGARAVFRTFFRDLYQLMKQRRCRYGLLVFLAPVCSFALPFAAVGKEFHTSENWMATINGPANAVLCSLGCVAAVYVSRWISVRLAYILTGLIAAVVTGVMMFSPRTMLVFTVGRLLYSFLEGINFAIYSAYLYELVGPNNPLAGTQVSLLSAASCLPIVYMTALDGFGFDLGGMTGMLAMDTFVAVAACVPILIFFHHIHRSGREEA
jgi:PAT family beta-lactamase induction signal transducer AmpG